MVSILVYDLHRPPGGVRIELYGEIDLSVRHELRWILQNAVATSPGFTNLDLDGVTFLDCGGIGEIVNGYEQARRRRHTLTVTRPHGIVRRVLELTEVLALLSPPGGGIATPAARDVVRARHALPLWPAVVRTE